MAIFNIHDAKTHFSKLINQAMSGEEIIIARGNRPLLRLTPYEAKAPDKRKGGQLKGILNFSEDFDAPLPEEVLKSFYRSDDKI